MEGFEGHEVPAGGARVEGFEDATAEGFGGNNEEEAAAGEAEWLCVHQAVVVKANEFVAEGVAVAGREGAEERFGKGVVGIGGEGGNDRGEDGVGCVTGLPSGRWGKASVGKASEDVFGLSVVRVEVGKEKVREEAVSKGG